MASFVSCKARSRQNEEEMCSLSVSRTNAARVSWNTQSSSRNDEKLGYMESILAGKLILLGSMIEPKTAANLVQMYKAFLFPLQMKFIIFSTLTSNVPCQTLQASAASSQENVSPTTRAFSGYPSPFLSLPSSLPAFRPSSPLRVQE